MLRDARSRPVLDNEEDSIPPQDGYTLGLTIDSVIQYIVEEEIEQMAVGSNASSAFAVVMEPFTGKILALANYPAYDLNEFAGAPGTCISNSAISNVFEPGSVFKIVTASAALNEGLFQLSDKIYCEKGLYRVGGRMLHDYHPYGELSFKKVIAKSSNIGTVKIAYRVGERVLYDYIKRFGFGEKTGVDLPGEVSGICRSPAVWSRSDMTTIPIGQGIAVTAIQLACAVGVIANGGYLMRPYVVDHIATWDGEIFQRHEPFVRRKVLDSSACAKMREVLRDVVVNGT
ncbi:MAG: penicillin-binding protein 2, partial [Candidatus Omnitrophica bacterium]|nr:penicillin-binding protein 2 [Candidatus Omnitrophota bacterium]